MQYALLGWGLGMGRPGWFMAIVRISVFSDVDDPSNMHHAATFLANAECMMWRLFSRVPTNYKTVFKESCNLDMLLVSAEVQTPRI